MYIQFRYEIHPRTRDHSHMCDQKVHAQATCAPDDDAQSTTKAHSGRNRARALRARAPDPGTDRTRASRSPRRYARCAWTWRCARAMVCDRAACGQHRAGAQRCKGCARAGASHLLSIDADEDLDALSKQGVLLPPAAGLSSLDANLAARGELTVSRGDGVSVGTGWRRGRGLARVGAHLAGRPPLKAGRHRLSGG